MIRITTNVPRPTETPINQAFRTSAVSSMTSASFWNLRSCKPSARNPVLSASKVSKSMSMLKIDKSKVCFEKTFRVVTTFMSDHKLYSVLIIINIYLKSSKGLISLILKYTLALTPTLAISLCWLKRAVKHLYTLKIILLIKSNRFIKYFEFQNGKILLCLFTGIAHRGRSARMYICIHSSKRDNSLN